MNEKESEWNIPQHEIESLARIFLPGIREFFSTEKGRREYEDWCEQERRKKNEEDCNSEATQ